MTPNGLHYLFSPILSLFWTLLSLIVLFFVGIWGSVRRGAAERREWALEIVLGGVCGVTVIAVDSLLALHGAFEDADFRAVASVRGSYASMLYIPAGALYAAGAVMAGAMLVAWATRSLPAWGPWVPFLFLVACANAGWFLLRFVPLGRLPSFAYQIDRAGLDRSRAEWGPYETNLDFVGFLATPPWMWLGKFDRVLALLLPVLAVLSVWAARKAYRKRVTCDDAERREFRESVTALGLLLLCLSVMRLAYLAEERLICVVLHRQFLLTTNVGLFLDWIRAGLVPILAAGAGGWLAWFGWSRFRPAAAVQDAPVPAGG